MDDRLQRQAYPPNGANDYLKEKALPRRALTRKAFSKALALSRKG
jgi:hypothetical protein